MQTTLDLKQFRFKWWGGLKAEVYRVTKRTETYIGDIKVPAPSQMRDFKKTVSEYVEVKGG